MGYKMKGIKNFGEGTPFLAKKKTVSKKDDEYGDIKKDQYPNLVEEQSVVQKDKKGLYTTGTEKNNPDGSMSMHSIGPHSVSDTTRYPKGFSDYKGEIKEGDYIDETTHEAWGGVDVEAEDNAKATGKRKVYNKKTKKYEDYKKK